MKETVKIDPDLLVSPVFWEDAWYEAKKISMMQKKRKTLEDTVNFWNQRAENFKENVMGEKGRHRVNRVLGWLELQGVPLEGIKVLDIGAGPGPFALAFAEKAEQVVALEPAENMTDTIRELINEKGINNIRIIQDTWEEVDLDKEGLRGEFDLVFASMSPGINSWETIRKALECSKKYFYVSQFAGRRQSSVMEELWQEVFGEEMPLWSAHAIYILNLLYARGFSLDFRVWEEKRTARDTVEEAAAFFIKEIHLFGREEPYPEEDIRKFLEKRADSGVFSHEMKTRLGKILVRL